MAGLKREWLVPWKIIFIVLNPKINIKDTNSFLKVSVNSDMKKKKCKNSNKMKKKIDKSLL